MLADSTLDESLLAVERLGKLTPALGAFSAGVALWAPGEELDEVMRRTDVALYEAKDQPSPVAVAPQPLTATC